MVGRSTQSHWRSHFSGVPLLWVRYLVLPIPRVLLSSYLISSRSGAPYCSYLSIHLYFRQHITLPIPRVRQPYLGSCSHRPHSGLFTNSDMAWLQACASLGGGCPTDSCFVISQSVDYPHAFPCRLLFSSTEQATMVQRQPIASSRRSHKREPGGIECTIIPQTMRVTRNHREARCG